MSILFLCLFVCGVQTDSEYLTKVSTRVIHNVKEKDGGIFTASGTGTIIRADKNGFDVLTCAHIFKHEEGYASGKIRVEIHDESSYRAKLIHYSEATDLALLRVTKTGLNLESAKIGKKESFPSDLRVMRYGYPGGQPSFAEGKVLPVRSRTGQYDSICTTVDSGFGNSGAGLFRKEDRQLVGVMWGSLENVSRCTQLKDVQDFLKEVYK